MAVGRGRTPARVLVGATIRARPEVRPIDIAIGLTAVVLLIAANAFFVAVEFALVAVDRDRVDRLAADGDRRARRTAAALRLLSFNLSGAQLGITVTSLLLGFIAEPTIAVIIEPALRALPFLPEATALGLSITLALAIATVTQMLVGELIPKGLAIAHPLPTSLALAGPLRVYSAVAGPAISFLNAAANRTCRRLGVEPREELASVRSMEELELLIRSSGDEGTLEPEAMRLLTRTLRFGHKHADDAMVPRVSMAALQEGQTVADLVRAALETGHSRFPVFGDDLDDIVGVVHVKDVFRIPVPERPATPVTAVMSEAHAIPESRDLESLLLEMRAEGIQMVVVVDEYGGTAGIITLEDLLEEIVGEIEDEHDPVLPAPHLTAPVRPGSHVLEGTLHPDEVRDLTELEIPEGDYETLAGFLLTLFDRIPEAGERAWHEGWTLEVAEMDHLRIALVRVTPPDGAGTGGSQARDGVGS